jgi:AAA domain, putative AbiEii toxin, Type IV TA system
MLRLVFQHQHKSIGALSEAPEMEQFSIVTGVNGSGKTHLLDAIMQSKIHVLIDEAPVQQTEIRLFSWQTLDVGQTGPVDYSARVSFMEQFWPTIQNLKEQHVLGLRARLLALGAEVNVAGTEALFVTAGEATYRDDVEVRNLLFQVNQRIFGQLQGHANEANLWQHRIDLETINPSHPGLAVMTHSQFRNRLVSSPITLDPFRQQLSAIFLAWRKAQEANGLCQLGFRSSKPLDHTEFALLYGAPPWELLNEMLEKGGHRFRVNSPEDDGPFEVEIRSDRSGAVWNFGDLSSGEKVLISFLLASYTVQNGFLKKQVPKILLLDEVDAPLHPSMIAGLLQVISDVLIRGQGVHCIMTTHNPATVALARSACFYKMSQEEPRLAACTSEVAIRHLSVGLPTLTVAVENRRVVWVESDYDVDAMDLITKSLGNRIEGPFVPVYQSVGFKAVEGRADTEQSGGKTRVKQVVKLLSEAGITAVRGLIDSDSTGLAPTQPGVFRLTDGERYSIENVLLDPLLVGLLIVREHMNCRGLNRAAFGLSEQGTFGQLALTDSAALQGVIDKVIETVGLPDGVVKGFENEKVVLLNEAIVELPKWFLEIQGHEWFNHLRSKLDCLGRWGTESALMCGIARFVLADEPEVITKAAVTTIQHLCQA